MSHELLLISGSPTLEQRERRRRVLEHAAARLPGSASWQVFEDAATAVALVETAPEGGSAVVAERDQDGTLVAAIGTSYDAARAACDGVAGPWSGAEHGHVKVVVADDGRVDVSTDGTGNLPSFWGGARGELVLATHLASLVSLGASPALDEVGAVEYLVMLHPLGTRTVLSDISLLPAGGRIRLDPGARPEVSVERLYVPSDDRMGDAEALHEFSQVWAALTADMLERTQTQRLALSLSGGLDSRAIAVECVRQGRRPHAFTYGSPTTRPAQVAAEVADALQLDHTLLAVNDDRLLADPAAQAMLLDGAHSPAEMYELWFGPALSGLADVVVNGKAGGTLWGDEKSMGLGDPALVLQDFGRRFGAELEAVTPFLAPDVASAARETFRTSLEESLREWGGSARQDLSLFWNVHNRQFRWGNMLTTSLRRSGLGLEAPFMDSRFLRFSARLTPEQRMNGRLYLQAHRQVFAETAQIARSDDGNAPRWMNHIYWSAEPSHARQFAQLGMKHPVSAARRGAGRLQGVVAHRIEQDPRLAGLSRGHDVRRSVFAADVWMRDSKAYRSRLHGFLAASDAPSIISADAVETTLAHLAAGEMQGGALRVARIATLQAWHRDFTRRAEALKSCR